jgi:hypothetical protein
MAAINTSRLVTPADPDALDGFGLSDIVEETMPQIVA